MSFEFKIREIIADNYYIDAVFGNFEVSSFKELEDLYEEERDVFMKKILSMLFSAGKYFNPLLIRDRSFLSSYSPRVRELMEYTIYVDSTSHHIKYKEWKGKQFEYRDFTLDDILIFCRLRKEPPLPITQHTINDEHLVDRPFILKKINQERLYKVHDGVTDLYHEILLEKSSGDFDFVMSTGKTFRLHSFLLRRYDFFSSLMSFSSTKSVTLSTENEEAVRLLIGFIYGQPIVNVPPEETVTELYVLADYLQLQILTQILEVLMDGTDLKIEYRRKQLSQKIEDLFSRFSPRLFKQGTNIDELKNRIIERIDPSLDTDVIMDQAKEEINSKLNNSVNKNMIWSSF